MKAKLLTDTVAPDFLYPVKNIDEKAGTVTLVWTTRGWNINEITVPLSEVQLVKEDGE